MANVGNPRDNTMVVTLILLVAQLCWPVVATGNESTAIVDMFNYRNSIYFTTQQLAQHNHTYYTFDWNFHQLANVNLDLIVEGLCGRSLKVYYP